MVLFIYFLLNVFFFFVNCLPFHKHHHQKSPRHPPPSSSSESSEDSFNYCAYNSFISGEKCGNQGLDESSFCVADINGNPVCIVSVWCYNLPLLCSSNSDCPVSTVCVNPFCGQGFQCNPLCGNPDLPYDPLYINVPYYSTSSDRCYDRSDVDLIESTPLYDTDPPREGSTYSSYYNEIHSTQVDKRIHYFETSIVLFLTLLIVVGFGTFVIIQRTPLKFNQFNNHQGITSKKESDQKIELEPFLREGKQFKREGGIRL